VQINKAVSQSSLLTFEASLSAAQAVTGDKLPLIDVHFHVISGMQPGRYANVIFLNGVYQLIPKSDASNIFTFAPQHFDGSDGSSTGLAIDVAAVRKVGHMLSHRQSPLFDQTGYKGDRSMRPGIPSTSAMPTKY
jgi:hypothetical protein